MADDNKHDAEMKKLSTLLLLAFGKVGASESERMTALQAVPNCLVRLCLTAHDLVARIQQGGNEKLTAAEIQVIYDKGFADGHSKGAEQGRRSAIIATARPMGIMDTSDIGPGVNGHDWFEIAQHCAANKDCIYRDKDRDFIDSVYEQMAFRGKPPTPPQAKWLRDIFKQRFGERID